MVDLAQFSVGLSVIAMQINQPMGEAKIQAFHMAMEDETSGPEWAAFCRQAVKRFGWRFLPSVPELLDALREFRGEPSLDSEAVAAYEAVIKAGEYTAEGGTSWTFRRVLEQCGRAAAEAFMEAGAHHAFASTWGEDKRRERFVAAYTVTVRAEPATRLLPPGSPTGPALLPAGPGLFPSPLALVRKIAKLAGELPREEMPARISADEWEARVEALRAQAARILTEQPIAQPGGDREAEAVLCEAVRK